MKQEYDFTEGTRGKYYRRYQAGSNVVVLEPEIAAIFTSSEAVNEALRTFVRAAGQSKPLRRARKARRRA